MRAWKTALEAELKDGRVRQEGDRLSSFRSHNSVICLGLRLSTA